MEWTCIRIKGKIGVRRIHRLISAKFIMKLSNTEIKIIKHCLLCYRRYNIAPVIDHWSFDFCSTCFHNKKNKRSYLFCLYRSNVMSKERKLNG